MLNILLNYEVVCFVIRLLNQELETEWRASVWNLDLQFKKYEYECVPPK